MTRRYRMEGRAEAVEQTRDRIIWATMQLHAEKGAAATTQADVAARSGLAPATVYRHFPTIGSLVRACGLKTWEALSPPRAEDSERLYRACRTTRARVRIYVAEISGFFSRAWAPIEAARAERRHVPELDAELRAIEVDLEALGREALVLGPHGETKLSLLLALTDFGVWKSLHDHGIPNDQIQAILTGFVEREVLFG